ncbi:hypothetical protein KAT45_01950, partial [Candidatus Aerophobetes bacterium]|nr:hypothetical protein [Candidatus Aerophobetes bacterium]
YVLLECDVAEIYPDNEASLIADWQSLRIKSPEELIESMTGALKESSTENPLVTIINAGILYNQLGTENAKRYVDTLIPLLDEVRQREKVDFITSAEYYRRLIGGKKPLVYSGQPDVPDVEENMFSSIEKKIRYFYSRLLEKLKIKLEENYIVKED